MNNTHRGYFLEGMKKKDQMLLVVSSLTNFTQAIAELGSRQYGSETLKMEPKLYNNLPVLMPKNIRYPDALKIYNKVDKALREENWEEASDLASHFIYGHLFGDEQAQGYAAIGKRLKDKLRELRA